MLANLESARLGFATFRMTKLTVSTKAGNAKSAGGYRTSNRIPTSGVIEIAFGTMATKTKFTSIVQRIVDWCRFHRIPTSRVIKMAIGTRAAKTIFTSIVQWFANGYMFRVEPIIIISSFSF